MGFKAGSVAPPTGKVKVLDSIQDRFAAFERKMPKDGYLGDDVGGTAKLPPSTSAWAVPWRPKSAPPRKELMKPGSYSPGPCYYPNDTWFGRGPHGQGPEYTLTGVSFRAPANVRDAAPVRPLLMAVDSDRAAAGARRQRRRRWTRCRARSTR